MTAGEDPTAKAHRSDADEALLRLILEAFALAKQSGKEDWQLMYAGPLKNRMLLLTGGEQDIEWTATRSRRCLSAFRMCCVSSAGASRRWWNCLSQAVSSLYRPVRRSCPADRIAEQSGVDSSAHDVRRWRIRKDLWDAVLGVRASDAFVWQDGTVVRVPHDQTADHAGTELPTPHGPQLDSWQGELRRRTTSRRSVLARSRKLGTRRQPDFRITEASPAPLVWPAQDTGPRSAPSMVHRAQHRGA